MVTRNLRFLLTVAHSSDNLNPHTSSIVGLLKCTPAHPLYLFFHFSRKALLSTTNANSFRDAAGRGAHPGPGAQGRIAKQFLRVARVRARKTDTERNRKAKQCSASSSETGRNAKLQQARLLPQATNRRPRPTGAQRPPQCSKESGWPKPSPEPRARNKSPIRSRPAAWRVLRHQEYQTRPRPSAERAEVWWRPSSGRV